MPATIIFSDIDSAFSKNPITNDLVRVTNEEAVKAAIKNLLFTGVYERFFQPNLFCGIDQDLFEPLTPITSSAIRNKIERVLQNFEPRIEEVKVEVATNREENGYDVTIHFLPKKSVEKTTLALFLERAI